MSKRENNIVTRLRKRVQPIITLAGFLLFVAGTYAQTTVFDPTGNPQNYTVPPCTSTLSVTLAGAGGGGPNGGPGAVLDVNIPVQPGDDVTIIVGETATGSQGGYPNGGNGSAANGTGNMSYGGGGSSMIYVNGVLVAVAGAGGGMGGGNTDSQAANGGCNSGSGTAQSPFGVGGGNGTQTAGGAGGPPWIASGNAGSPGSYLQGGNGGSDPCYNLGPGGGGGGGYYGGGGGGSDCFGSGSLGGGAGGGGSSLIPAGSPCTQGQNYGDGSVVIGAGLGVVASNTGPYCVGSTIQLNATAGGTTYTWTGPNGFTSTQQNPTIPAATLGNGGTYSVVATGTGCSEASTTDVVVVDNPTPMAGNDTTIPLSGMLSDAANTFSWSLNTNGITPTPSVSYSPNMTSIAPTVTVNQPGLYSFTLTEDNGVCPAATDLIDVTISVTNHTTSFVEPSCEGMSDGSITITNPDGVNYSYDGGTNWVTNATQGGFPVGTYTVVSENQYGCIHTSDVTITEPLPIIISAGNDTLICEKGTANMWASISVAGMNEAYHWSHDPGTAYTSTISPLANTTVMVYAEAANGCLSDTTYIQVDVRPGLSGTISAFDTICPGYPTTIGVAGLTGGIGAPYDIIWDSGETGSGTMMDIEVNPPVTQTYTATITDACESTPLVLTTEVYVAPLPVPMMSVVDPTICEPAVFEVSNLTDPAMVSSYFWILSDGQTYADESPFFTEEMYHGSYDVQLIVTSPLGCIDSITNYDFLTVYQKPVAKFQWSPNPVRMFNTEVEFANQSFLGHEYYWTFQDGIPATSTVERPKIQFPDGVTGSYEVTLYVTSEHGCMDTITRVVDVLPEVLIYAPTAFTPDGDEHNQNWNVSIEGIDIYSYNLTIYNRWGEIIWESNDASIGWDGTYNGKLVQAGTYAWKIEARDGLNDGKYVWNGHMNVLR